MTLVSCEASFCVLYQSAEKRYKMKTNSYFIILLAAKFTNYITVTHSVEVVCIYIEFVSIAYVLQNDPDSEDHGYLKCCVHSTDTCKKFYEFRPVNDGRFYIPPIISKCLVPCILQLKSHSSS